MAFTKVIPNDGKRFKLENYITVTAGNTQKVNIPPLSPNVNIACVALPGGGGTAKIEYTCSSQTKIDADTCKWFEWPGSDVSDDTVDTLIGPVNALRLTATTADADFELLIMGGI